MKKLFASVLAAGALAAGLLGFSSTVGPTEEAQAATWYSSSPFTSLSACESARVKALLRGPTSSSCLVYGPGIKVPGGTVIGYIYYYSY